MSWSELERKYRREPAIDHPELTRGIAAAGGQVNLRDRLQMHSVDSPKHLSATIDIRQTQDILLQVFSTAYLVATSYIRL